MAKSMSEFDFPKKTIYKIIKSVLPEKTQLSEEARNAIARCAVVFVMSVTRTAQIVHKTNDLKPEMILQTIADMGFEEFREPLEQFIQESRKPKVRKSKSANNEVINIVEKSLEENNEMKTSVELNGSETIPESQP